MEKIFWLSILVAFRGVLRICHVTDSIHSLRVKDLYVCDEYVRLHIRSSKTDQFGQHPYNIYLQRSDDSPLCPALLLLDVLNTRGVHNNSKVFSVRKKNVFICTRILICQYKTQDPSFVTRPSCRKSEYTLFEARWGYLFEEFGYVYSGYNEES